MPAAHKVSIAINTELKVDLRKINDAEGKPKGTKNARGVGASRSIMGKYDGSGYNCERWQLEIWPTTTWYEA